MLYLYQQEAGVPSLSLEGDAHRYIFKVRRHKIDDILCLRNLQDTLLYYYRIDYLDKRKVVLELQKTEKEEISSTKSLHIGWCIIDPKSVEKVLPSLNEMGVETITFIYCQRSQKSFKLDFKRLEKMLLNSSQQSGRSKMMVLKSVESLDVFMREYPQSYLLHFSENKVTSSSDISSIVIGCEGGLTADEVGLFDRDKIIGLDTPMVLKSESAVCAVVAKVLL